MIAPPPIIEESFELDSPAGHVIYGLWNRGGEALADRIVVFAHGYPSSINAHQFETGKHFFTERGFDVARFAFFGGQEKALKLRDVTLKGQARDLTQVIDYFGNRYDQIFLVGHSYGGLAAVIANPENVRAISFWDPTVGPAEAGWTSYTTYNEVLDACIMDGSHPTITGKAAYEEAMAHDTAATKALAGKLKAPVQVVLAEAQPEKMDRSQIYHAAPPGLPKELIRLEGTTHSFAEGNKIFELLEHTNRWFAQCGAGKAVAYG